MALYFAHAMPIYGKHEESVQLGHIKSKFINESIINPASYSNHPEKRKDMMAFCYKLLDGCNILVFTKWRKVITSGVGLEVNYALTKGIEVFELVNAKFIRITKPVIHQTQYETLSAYYGEKFAKIILGDEK